MPFASGYENDGALLRAVAAVSEALPTRFALLKVSDRQAPETGVVVYISHATQNRGIPMSMLLGRSASEVAPSLFSATGLGAAITRALTSGEVQTPDAMRLSSGDVVRNDVIKLTLHPLADDLVAIVYQNRSVEHELAENRAFLEAVVDNIPAVLFVKDADTLHFTLINRAAEALFGVPREQAYGKGDYDLFPREQADFFVGMDRAALRGDESVEIPEEPISTPAGLRWLHTRKVGLKTRDGRSLYLLGVSEDITERKRAREELARRTAELQRSNGELELFAQIASHDLKAPLRAIRGFLDRLVSRHGDQLGPDADKLVQRALHNAANMAEMLDGLLRYVQVDTTDISGDQVALDAVVASAIGNLEASIAEAGATVEYADLPMVSGERLLLVQLFQNLIGNAIKFRSEATPHITITAAKAAAGAPDASADCDPPQDRDDLVTIAVRDNGIGIASGDRERIFQIFQRSDPNGAHPGSGIGLAIVKKIVTSHSGRVSLESAPGAGSTFYVTLPGAHDPVPTRP